MSSSDLSSEVVLASLSSFGNYDMGPFFLSVMIGSVVLTVGLIVWKGVNGK